MREFDIIHLHYPFIFGAEMVWAISKVRGTPYVLTYHNDLIGSGLLRSVFKAYSTFSTRLVFKQARKLAAVSLDHAVSCCQTAMFRRRWEDVVEIPNGVDTSLFRPGLDGKSLRQEYGIPDSAQLVLFVGGLDRAHCFKGVPYLLRALAHINDSKNMAMIVGEGDMKGNFVALARDLGLADRVVFAGAKPHEELVHCYAAADIVVLPSLPPESFGMVLVEAMACGKPVIASNLPGVRSVVIDGQDGLLIEPRDVDGLAEKVRELLGNRRLREEMGKRGRSKVEQKYAWPRIIPRLVEVYESVLSV
jgi:glycosyltransferase involved in cell wall biosynthesis